MGGNFDFSGRTALITGAASGIGAACAQWLDAHGIAELILIDLDRSGLDKLGLGCKVRPFGGDVSDPSLWSLMGREPGRIDHAIINAGVACSDPIVDIDIAEWKRVMAVNLDGVFLGLRTAMRRMQRQQSGSIVLTSSVSGLKAMAGVGAYGASKAAVAHLARVAAIEGAPHGVRVNAIAPGGVDTPIWDKQQVFRDMTEAHGGRDAAMTVLGQAAPLGRCATAPEIAGQIGFLLSDMAATITGTVLISDGGVSL